MKDCNFKEELVLVIKLFYIYKDAVVMLKEEINTPLIIIIIQRRVNIGLFSWPVPSPALCLFPG